MRDQSLDLIIFDCDGVLVDSEIIAAQVEAALLSESGYPISVGEMKERFCGMSWSDILRSVERDSGLELMTSLFDKSEAILDERLELDVQAIDGVAFALSQLPYTRCICSNTKPTRLDAMLLKVDLRSLFAPHIFSAITLGAKSAKPKPDIFLHGAKQMRADPKKTIVVEDSSYGVQGARAAGMRVIGFIGGSHTYPGHATRLMESGAEVTISAMQDLPPAIAALVV